jgi:hypothetical protein
MFTKEEAMTVFMTRAPISISDEALMQFAVGAVLILTAIAFVAYVWTWLAARPRRSERPRARLRRRPSTAGKSR